ncbi:MAG: ribokinase [Clostridium sp.]|nr:ribokinase [Clostridium sp.]MDY5484592.1 ribokinase [Clostridium sp.]
MKILNFGSLNIDYTYSVEHFVRAGETLSSASLAVFSGGKGLNQSIALRKAGAEVWHAGAVGKEDGEFLIEQLSEAGVHTELIAHTEGKTGHAIIQKDPAGQNCILLYGGANQEISKEMVDRVMDRFGEGDFLILQNEISEIGYIMEQAHARGMRIVLNPSPMNEKILTYPLDYVDYFLLNEIEASDLCGMESTKNADVLMAALTQRFPEAKIVLTLGGDGSIYRDGETQIHQGIYRVPVVDTTAAGDTFTGYFIGGLQRGESAEEALDHAARAAAIAVSRPGAAPSIPSREEVELFTL